MWSSSRLRGKTCCGKSRAWYDCHVWMITREPHVIATWHTTFCCVQYLQNMVACLQPCTYTQQIHTKIPRAFQRVCASKATQNLHIYMRKEIHSYNTYMYNTRVLADHPLALRQHVQNFYITYTKRYILTIHTYTHTPGFLQSTR